MQAENIYLNFCCQGLPYWHTWNGHRAALDAFVMSLEQGEKATLEISQ
jgi:hypothetical protein